RVATPHFLPTEPARRASARPAGSASCPNCRDPLLSLRRRSTCPEETTAWATRPPRLPTHRRRGRFAVTGGDRARPPAEIAVGAVHGRLSQRFTGAGSFGASLPRTACSSRRACSARNRLPVRRTLSNACSLMGGGASPPPLPPLPLAGLPVPAASISLFSGFRDDAERTPRPALTSPPRARFALAGEGRGRLRHRPLADGKEREVILAP